MLQDQAKQSRIRGLKIRLHFKVMELDNLHGLERVLRVITQETELQKRNTHFFRETRNNSNVEDERGESNEETPQAKLW